MLYHREGPRHRAVRPEARRCGPMTTRALAAVAIEPRRTEVREFALPEIAPDAGLLRVEATGICGSDWGMYLRDRPGPRILGHEMIGTIETLGDIARER